MSKLVSLFVVLLVVSFTSCDKPNEETVSTDSIIELEAVSDISNVKADGVTILQFKATIAQVRSTDTRDITFILSEANFGKFTGTSTDNKKVIKSDAQGVSLASVRIGTVPGNYFITAEVKVGDAVYRSKDIAITILALGNGDKIQLTADNLQPVADGASLVNFQVKSTFSVDKKVTLTSNMGGFINTTDPKIFNLVLDDQGNGTVVYRIINEAIPNIITATLSDGSFTRVTLTPQLSYTELILVEPSGLKVDTIGGSVQFNVFLKKNVNNFKVTKNSPVFFSATQTVNNIVKPVGRFTGTNLAVSDIDGIVPAVKFFGDTGGIDTLYPIRIEVSAFKSATEKIIFPLLLTVKPR